MAVEIAPGIVVPQVGDILDGVSDTDLGKPFAPPKHPDMPDFPEPGIYFGMPESTYHSIFACSASGLKKLSISSMDAWSHSPLNQEREEPKPKGEMSGKELGRAYHARICEGLEAFNERYYVGLDRDAVRFEAEAKGKPLCVTIADIRMAIDAAEGKPKGTGKDALIDQLLDLDPDAYVWERIEAKHEEANQGKIKISQKLYRRIEIANAMIEGDPQLRGAFKDGHAEVSIFWYDEATGVPMKARLDFLKMNHLVDLKSLANKMGKPIQRAIDAAISFEKYYIAVVVYLEAIAAAKRMVRDTRAVFFTVLPEPEDDQKTPYYERSDGDLLKWCWQWAHQPEPECLWVFQQTGAAPVTRGRIMVKGTTFLVTDHAVQFLKRQWRLCALTYGTDPWVSLEPVTRTEDEALGFAATDFGEIQ